MHTLTTEFQSNISDVVVSLDRADLWKLLAIGAVISSSTEDGLSLVETISDMIIRNPDSINTIFHDILDNAKSSTSQPLDQLLQRLSVSPRLDQISKPEGENNYPR